MKTVKHLLISMLVFSIASSPILAGGETDTTTPAPDSAATSAPAGTPGGSDTPAPDSDATEATPPAEQAANSGMPQPTDSAPAEELAKPAKSSSPVAEDSKGNNNQPNTPDKDASNPDMQQLKTELAALKEENKKLKDKPSKDNSSDAAFEMPFFSPKYAATKPVYDFFKARHDSHPKIYKGVSYVTLAIAATFLIGKGMEHTSAFVKKIMTKPKHKETEKLYTDLATKSAIVVLGFAGAFGLKCIFNGLTPVPGK